MLRIIGAGAEREGDIRVDEHIPLMIDWPRRPVPALWWMFSQPGSMLQTGFDAATGELVDVTLVVPGPIASVDHGPPPAAPHTVRGTPRADPAEWDRRTPHGAVKEFQDQYIREPLPVRTELGPAHLLVRIGEEDEAAASELVCGRLRAGLSAEQSLLWLCVDGFSPEERALLDEHAGRSHARPTMAPPTPAPQRRGLSRFIDQLLKRG
ncbi:MAG TPA: hypothetical protein VFT45_15950 [Longimicrobium sp.]|nr:hypothetical protein [Longimicrobium sp.]